MSQGPSSTDHSPITAPTVPRAPGWPLLGSEFALWLVSVVSLTGLVRLFDGYSFLPKILAVATISHLIAAVLRRTGLGIPLSILTSTVAMVPTLATVIYPATTRFLLPTADTWRTAGADLSEAWDAFGVVKAPTEALTGFVLAIAVAAWTMAQLSDIAAFRIRTSVEALVPATTLVVFTAILGTSQYRLQTTIAFLSAVGLFLLLFRIAFPPSPSLTIRGYEARLGRARLQHGLVLLSGGLLAAAVFGPLLPGVGDSAVIDLTELDGSGGGTRVTLSPLVDARGRLVQQTDVELFRVRTSSEVGAYWRTTALDLFDGGVWGSSYSYSPADGVLTPPPGDGQVVTQEIVMSNLGDIWLPAAYQAVGFDGTDARWDAESATLVTAEGDTTGLTYTVQSVVPIFDPTELRAADTTDPVSIAVRYTDLPDGFSPDIAALAADLTSDQPTRYDQALALQSYFRDNYDYSTDVPEGHSLNRMEQFVFADRTGYCEQFAGTFAAMARSVGIPARVAVGFTPGERVGDEFIVRGRNYHAWPEVYIGGQWVPFEPTPGRGSPQAEAWTGVAPAQDETPVDQIVEPTTAPEANLAPQADPTDLTPNLDELANPETSGTAADGGGLSGSGVPAVIRTLGLGLLIGLVAVGGWLALTAAVPAWRRYRRRSRARNRRERVEASWIDLTEMLRAHSPTPGVDETRREYANRVDPVLDLDEIKVGAVATLVDAVVYSGPEPDADLEDTADRMVETIGSELAGRETRLRRWRRRLDPNSLRGR